MCAVKANSVQWQGTTSKGTDMNKYRDYDNYLNWVRALRDYIPNTIDADIYTLPLTMDRIDFEDANDIERVLREVDIIIENII